LRGETESYRRELASLDEEQATKAPELSEIRKHLTALRLELSGVKQETEALDDSAVEAKSRRRTKFVRDEERLKADLSTAEEALARHEIQAANRREDARAMYAVRYILLFLFLFPSTLDNYAYCITPSPYLI